MAEEAVSADLMNEVGDFIAEVAGCSLSADGGDLSLVNNRGTVLSTVAVAGGSEVEVTPTLMSGEEVARITVDGTTSVLYAPTASSMQTVWYGTCSTEAATAAKESMVTGFELEEGAVLFLRAAADQRVIDELTLDVSGTGAKTIYANGKVTSSTNGLVWHGGETLVFVYDGSFWQHVAGGQPAPSHMAATLSANTSMTFSSTFSYQTIPFNAHERVYDGCLTFNSSAHTIDIGESGWYCISGVITANAPYYARLMAGSTILANVTSNQSGYLSNAFGSQVFYLEANTKVSITLAKSTNTNPTVAGGRLTMITVERVR